MQDVPYGLCHCGCGQQTKLATKTRPKWAHVKGEPMRFLRGHNAGSDPGQRFWASTDRVGPTMPRMASACWQWQGALSDQGYGKLTVEGRTVAVHRFAYEFLVGAIPDGLQIDHLCRIRARVNPDHLEAVTARENTLRGHTIQTLNAAATHCLHGHALTGSNLYIDARGHRSCRACHRRWSREWRKRQVTVA